MISGIPARKSAETIEVVLFFFLNKWHSKFLSKGIILTMLSIVHVLHLQHRLFKFRAVFSNSSSLSIYFVFNSFDSFAESEMKFSAWAVKRQVRRRADQERCKQNSEFCIQSRFRMQSYSSSASQIGYRACGEEKVINMRWIPEQPLTSQRRKQIEENKIRQEEGKVKCSTAGVFI